MKNETTLQVTNHTKLSSVFKNKWNEIKRNKVSYLFIAPFMIIFTLFTIIPVILSLGLSFTYYNILEPPQFIGFQNYLNLLLADDVFLIAVKNTFLLSAITGPIGFFAALILAWLINDLKPKMRAFATLIFYAPTISGQVYLIWSVMFSGDAYGYVNGFLMKLGFIKEPVQWLTEPKYMLWIIMIVILWMSLGTGFLSFIAGLQGIDKTLFEAGYVDGVKNRWQELWYITLPSMKPQLMFGAVMSITQSFAVYEVTVALAGFPSTDYAATTIVTHLMDYGSVRFEMGYASAIATILFLSMVITNKIVQSLLKKVGR